MGRWTCVRMRNNPPQYVSLDLRGLVWLGLVCLAAEMRSERDVVVEGRIDGWDHDCAAR